MCCVCPQNLEKLASLVPAWVKVLCPHVTKLNFDLDSPPGL